MNFFSFAVPRIATLFLAGLAAGPPSRAQVGGAEKVTSINGGTRVHMFSNYFNSTGNFSCSNARADFEMLSENKGYAGVRNPCYTEAGKSLQTLENIYDQCSGKAEQKNDGGSKPPYAYFCDQTKKYPAIVRGGAGVP